MEDSQEEAPEEEVVSIKSDRMKVRIYTLLIILILITACSRTRQDNELGSAFDVIEEPSEIFVELKDNDKHETVPDEAAEEVHIEKDIEIDIESLLAKYAGVKPIQWGDRIDGMKSKLGTDERIVSLTFDACGGSESANGYDEKIIEYLRKENIPATLFVTKTWIETNTKVFKELASDPLFEIANHGSEHKPLSVVPNEAYGIDSTDSVKSCINEVMDSALYIKDFTGLLPLKFRSGTAYADDVSLKILDELGMEFIGYDVAADAGATFNQNEILEQFKTAEPGSIILMHFNHPESESYDGLVSGVEYLKSMGYEFCRLDANR